MKKIWSIILGCGILFFVGCAGSKKPVVSAGAMESCPKPQTLAGVVGATHVRGNYYLTDKDYLNEGADQLLEMGSRVIKIWFYGKRHEHPEHVYQYNSNWPPVSSLVEGAKLPYFKTLFNKPFSTYILVVTSLGRTSGYWHDGITQEQAQDETRQFYELTKYLLTAYKGSGKTFVFQHWEGDWMTRQHFDRQIDPKPEVHQNMIKWLNARQAGVNKARQEVGCHGVNVYHAVEVNTVVLSLEKSKPNIVNAVLPFTSVDLVSYSAYDSIFDAKDGRPELFGQCLQYIKDHLPPSAVFGPDSVYVGEFGVPENDQFSQDDIQRVVKNTVETSLRMHCPWVVYWQLYCNEVKQPSQGVAPAYGVAEDVPNYGTLIKTNDQARGFWLIRVDGTKSWVYNYLSDVCRKPFDEKEKLN